jgi:predicted ribosomally synthesized peptide with nif11-like leader
MSIESAKAFLERVKNDEDFRKESEGQASVEERIKFAKAQGFDFTKDEIQEMHDSLTEEELDAVAGGFRGRWTRGMRRHMSRKLEY